jgi:hypothetical protein
MQGATIGQLGFFPTIADPNWQYLATDDFDGDGKADLAWRHSPTGLVAIWLMDGFAVRDARVLPLSAGRARLGGTGDTDGDGRADRCHSRAARVEHSDCRPAGPIGIRRRTPSQSRAVPGRRWRWPRCTIPAWRRQAGAHVIARR